MFHCCFIITLILTILVLLFTYISENLINYSPVLPYPSQEEIDKLITLDNTSKGLTIFAHVSDLHIGTKKYLTQNSRFNMLLYK